MWKTGTGGQRAAGAQKRGWKTSLKLCVTLRGNKNPKKKHFFERTFLLPEGWRRWWSNWPIAFRWWRNKTGWQPKLPFQDQVLRQFSSNTGLNKEEEDVFWLSGPVMTKVWESMTRPGLDTHEADGREIFGYSVFYRHTSTRGLSGNHVALSATSEWVLCPAAVEWSLSDCLRAGLDYWTSHEQLLSCPERKWRKGRTAGLKKSRPVWPATVFFSSSIFKRNFPLAPVCRPQF